MKFEDGTLSAVKPADLTKDGWFVVKNNVKRIDSRAFTSVKDELKKVVFENGCEVIENHAFDGCANLTGVLLPQTLYEIGACAFYGCGLVRVDIPENVKSICNEAFMRCTSLKVVKFEANVDGWKNQLGKTFDGTLVYDGVFDYCPNIEKFVYKKHPYDMGIEISRFKKAEIVICEDEEAEKFWLKKLAEFPMEYQHLDEVRATTAKYDSFRNKCKQVIESRYKTRTGLEDVSTFVKFAMSTEKYDSKEKK